MSLGNGSHPQCHKKIKAQRAAQEDLKKVGVQSLNFFTRAILSFHKFDCEIDCH